MIRKFLWIIAVLMVPAAAMGQSTQYAEVDASEPLNIVGMTIAAAPVTSNFTAWEYHLTEPDGTTTQITMGSGTGNNQCTAEVNSLLCHITLDQQGNHLLTWKSAANSVVLGWSAIHAMDEASMDLFRRGEVVIAPTGFSGSWLKTDGSGVDIAEWLGAAINAAIAGRPDVNLGAAQTDVVTAGALAASAVTEIQSGLPIISKNQEYVNYPIFMRSAANPNVGITGQTVTCQRNTTGSWVNATNNGSISASGRGFYYITWTADETNANSWALICEGTGGTGVSQPYTQIIFTNH